MTFPCFTEECKEVVSEPYGTPDVGQRYAFTFADPDERLLSVDVRAGAWIDAVRFHTNKKSSVWMGGSGGNLHQLKAPPGREIRGLFGTSGTFVTSLGAILHRSGHARSAVELSRSSPVSGKPLPSFFVGPLKARLHIRFLMRFRVQNAPYPTLHECLFREA